MTIEEHLKRFRVLPSGWHYGQGIATTDAAYTEALRLYHSFNPQYRLYEVFPKINGGVLLSCYTNERTVIEYEIEPDGTYFIGEEESY